MHHMGILMYMRTTLNIDDSLLINAAKLTGVKEKTSLVHLGSEALSAKESARRLANLGATDKRLRAIRRRRPRKSAEF
jgi:Arc/MetJ family transcription regulator